MNLTKADVMNLAGRVLQYVINGERVRDAPATRVDVNSNRVRALLEKLVHLRDELLRALVANLAKKIDFSHNSKRPGALTPLIWIAEAQLGASRGFLHLLGKLLYN